MGAFSTKRAKKNHTVNVDDLLLKKCTLNAIISLFFHITLETCAIKKIIKKSIVKFQENLHFMEQHKT